MMINTAHFSMEVVFNSDLHCTSPSFEKLCGICEFFGLIFVILTVISGSYRGGKIVVTLEEFEMEAF
jgi:hypothetical protein